VRPCTTFLGWKRLLDWRRLVYSGSIKRSFFKFYLECFALQLRREKAVEAAEMIRCALDEGAVTCATCGNWRYKRFREGELKKTEELQRENSAREQKGNSLRDWELYGKSRTFTSKFWTLRQESKKLICMIYTNIRPSLYL
jgi:hypothetical protein